LKSHLIIHQLHQILPEISYPDYKKLYEELSQEHHRLKTEMNIIKQNSDVNYKTINESLRFNMKILQKNLNTSNSILKLTQTNFSKQIKTLSITKNKAIELKAKKYLSTIFSPNQLDLIMKKKMRVNWSRDEISKAFTLRYLSKRAYVYVKDKLHYPLLGKNKYLCLYL